MKALITGFNGFVGKYLAKELSDNGYEVIGTDITGSNVEIADFLNVQSVFDLLVKHNPDVVFHLAGQASVGLSWQNPRKTFDINVGGIINLLDTARQLPKKPKLLIIGSSDQYGIVKPEDCPIRESNPLNPQSPYAISKAAQEMTAIALSKAYGLEIVLTRSFNHIGPGQKKGFVVADFASEIAEIEIGRKEAVLYVGNLDAQRDFTDVRDITRAYRLLIEKGHAGEIYNIGSGTARSIRSVLLNLLSQSKIKIDVVADPQKYRVLDNPLFICNYDKLYRDTGWKPYYDIRETLKMVLDYYRLNVN